jgi:hypothetical protein
MADARRNGSLNLPSAGDVFRTVAATAHFDDGFGGVVTRLGELCGIRV